MRMDSLSLAVRTGDSLGSQEPHTAAAEDTGRPRIGGLTPSANGWILLAGAPRSTEAGHPGGGLVTVPDPM